MKATLALLFILLRISPILGVEKVSNFPLYDAMDGLNNKLKYNLSKLGYKNIIITKYDFPTQFPNEIKNYLSIRLESLSDKSNVKLAFCKECTIIKATSTNGTLFTDSSPIIFPKETITKYAKRYSIQLKLENFGTRYILLGDIIDNKTTQVKEKIKVSVTTIDQHQMKYKINIAAGLVLGKLYGAKIQSLYRWPSLGEGGIKLAFLTSSVEPKSIIALMPVFDWNIDEIYRELLTWGDTYLTTGLGYQISTNSNEIAISLGLKQTLLSHMMVFFEMYKSIMNVKNKSSASLNNSPLTPMNLLLGVGIDF